MKVNLRMLEWKWQRSTLGMGSRCPPVTWRGKGGGEEVGYFQISWFKSKAIVLYENFQWGWGGWYFCDWNPKYENAQTYPSSSKYKLKFQKSESWQDMSTKVCLFQYYMPTSPIFWNNIARAFPVTRFRSQDGCTTMYDVLAILRDSERTCGKVEF